MMKYKWLIGAEENNMAGGQRINDHSAWMGSSSNGNPLPMETKMKTFPQTEGMGELSTYEDTEESIRAIQEGNKRQAKKNPFGPHQRN